MTDENGYYEFANVPDGTYIVEEVQQPGWVQTTPVNPGYYEVAVDSDGIILTGTVDGNVLNPDTLNYTKQLICGGSATIVINVYGASPGKYEITNTALLIATTNGAFLDEDSCTGPTITVVGENGAPDNLDFGNYTDRETDGLTPGFWKNWDNHYTPEQFNKLLEGTFVGQDIDAADAVFASYSNKKGMELTLLKAHLLAAQLTINLSSDSQMPNPDNAFLLPGHQVEYNGQSISVGEVIDRALDIINDPSSYTREQITEVKDMLDYINNL